MQAYQQINLQNLSESIASIRRVVRRRVNLPRAIYSIREIKKKYKKDTAEPTPLETADDPFRRLQNAK